MRWCLFFVITVMHHHHPASAGREKKLLLAFALTLTMMVIEAIGGWWSGSLALLTDAAHMLVDALALLMAVVAAWVARRPPDGQRSYGYARVEVLSGFTSGVLQVVLILFIVIEAIQRLFTPAPILSNTMLAVAVAGLVINVLVFFLLHHHAQDDVNVSGAVLHVMGDLLGSVAAIVAALLIDWQGWLRADPLLSLLVSVLILRSAWMLLRRSSHILLEGVPEDVETDDIPYVLCASDTAIQDVHHLHVWQLASGSRVATLHVSLCPGADSTRIMQQIKQVLHERYGIGHTTVQMEETEACPDSTGQEADTGAS